MPLKSRGQPNCSLPSGPSLLSGGVLGGEIRPHAHRDTATPRRALQPDSVISKALLVVSTLWGKVTKGN
ncbi:hypothetical protein KIN20_029367 [Parelaphostrongylus tenuis]|uniref:Uncharacterized protein n=1 Tax=Parelaphostrongylus tenuis TaxID=148309 RepID=A0AAD5WFK5_PARTN|nr:hypothetical protein KIN20_029367 [Parelaphostrongylus tenuis]